MRLRHKPWATDFIAENPHFVVPNPEECQGNWSKDVFHNDNPIYIEVGTGKGSFVTGMGKQHPDVNFLGVELYPSVIISALQRLVDEPQDNVKLLNQNAEDVTKFFAENEVSRVYLNFSDPWPKKRHEKRRLTYKAFLDLYKQILIPNGEIHFKTDNQQLFEYSLESFSRYGMIVKNVSLDLHNSDIEGNVMTEYEEKFSNNGNRIYRCEAQFRE
ncbi:tRNA (guanosine(46)-N7)-methyltransferase TrmB [Bacillus solimangrovi]|uniref:tRNA (guanine-N(7)-)-methyltransferase n=1 Tax=Bacillus solimangrovi TaxID=1305675 RepID=A0A1E5LCV0_9BACI|nr:tRNA (guanosine(46)-N7)-methyltransferase TrmB [Bacillus solimangrovi]OEH91911.1 tRNA (guanosine(46)-N7)-methyltransferase TrmB [Bacillus solimangrovi]